MDIDMTAPRAGWRITDWCRAVGIARSTYYALSRARQPTAVHVGIMHIVTEPPDAWLARVGRPIHTDAGAA